MGPPAVRRLACVPHPEDAALCDPDDPTLTVELTAPLPARALARAVVLEPPAAWSRAAYEGDEPIETLSIHPEIKPGTKVRLRIDAARGGPELSDAWGQRLTGAAVDLRFGNRPSEVRFGIGGTYWGARARHDFPVVLTNAPGVEISAAPYPLEQVLADLAGAPAPPAPGARSVTLAGRVASTRRCSTTSTWTISSRPARGPVRFLSTAPGAATEGYDDPAQRPGHQRARRPRLRRRAGERPRRRQARARRLDRGVPRAPAREHGSAPCAMGVAGTGADGSASVPLSAPFGDGDRVAVVARTAADWAYATLSAPRLPRTVGVLYTERGIYRPGETVKLSGIFRVPGPSGAGDAGRRGGHRRGGRDAQHARRLTTAATLSEFGTFAVDVPLRTDLPVGRYRAFAHAKGGEGNAWFRSRSTGPRRSPSRRRPAPRSTCEARPSPAARRAATSTAA